MREVGVGGILRVPQVGVGILAVLGSAWLAGCYQYVPLVPGAAPAGARVRAELTPAGTQRLVGELGSGGGDRIEGRIVEGTPGGGLLLDVFRATREAPVGISSRSVASRVSLTSGDIARLELKELDRGRTALFVGGSALFAGLLVTLAFSTYGRGSEGGGPPVDEALVPLLTIRW
jgi:hypothetical protein